MNERVLSAGNNDTHTTYVQESVEDLDYHPLIYSPKINFKSPKHQESAYNVKYH